MQTLEAIATRLPPDLAILAAEHVCPGNATPEDAALYGHFEIAATTADDDLTTRMFRRACRGGHTAIVDMLIDRGECDWKQGFRGACRGGHTTIMDRMIARGATNWGNGFTEACCGGHLDIIGDMMDRRPMLYVCTHKHCKAGTLSVVRHVMEIGCRHYNVMCAFARAACRGGHLDTFEYLLQQGLGEYEHEAYLHAACEGGHPTIIDRLVALGAHDWLRALEGAAIGGHLPTVQFVLDKLDPDADVSGGARHAYTGGHLHVVTHLLPRIKDMTDSESMRRACEGGNLGIVKLLVQHGNTHWRIGMPEAIYHGNLEMIEYLAARGDHDWDGCLVEATRGGHLRVVQYCISHGANTAAAALGEAVEWNRARVARYLASLT
jgi:hypothetical protein